MLAKVVELNKDNLKVHEQIQRYLDKLGRKSEQTRIKYEGDIKFYFKLMKDKDIEHLQTEDVQLTLDDFEDYIKKLVKLKNKKGERYYTNKTINSKITSLKGLIKYLAAKGVVEDIGYFPLIESLANITEHIDAMTLDEVMEMSRLAGMERDKPIEKTLLILTALNTGLRKAEILNLKWKDFVVYDDDLVIVKGVGKGTKSFKKYITMEFYQELLKLKETNKVKVFSIPRVTLDKLFERLRDKMNTDFGGRNITFHSIRKTYGTRIHNTFNDINLTRKALNHSSVTTTQIYISDDSEDEALRSVCMMEKIDKDLYKKTERDILIEAISKLDSGQIMLLNKKIMELNS